MRLNGLLTTLAMLAACHPQSETHAEVSSLVSLTEGTRTPGDHRIISDIVADDLGVAWLASSDCVSVDCKHFEIVSSTYDGSASILLSRDSGDISGLALSGDNVLFTSGNDLEQVSRKGGQPSRLAVLPGEATLLMPDGGYLYFRTLNHDTLTQTVGRVPSSGGSVQVINSVPASQGDIAGLAVSDGRVAVCQLVNKQWELWRLDGEFRKIGDLPRECDVIAIDGSQIVAGGDDYVVRQPIDGGQRDLDLKGSSFVATQGGIVYASRRSGGPGSGTYAFSGSAAPRRVGPNATDGHVSHGRLYGHFYIKDKEIVGSVSLR